MTKVEHIGDATLYLGDCREVLPAIESVDHCIMDPPYGEAAHTLIRRRDENGVMMSRYKTPQIEFDALDDDLRLDVCEIVADRCSGWVLAFCQVEQVADWRADMLIAGMKWRRAIAWVRLGAMPKMNGDGPSVGYECIAAAWAGQGNSRWNGGGKVGVYTASRHLRPHEKSKHETVKPSAIMDPLVADFTNHGETIVDCFMGSGSTGVAAVEAGRRFIGIEINPEYFDIACERIDAAQRQGRLFA